MLASIYRKYKCSKCKVRDCKLWRDYGYFLNHTKLYCCKCAFTEQDKPTKEVDENGKYLDEELQMKTDQIGWLVPAVLTGEGSFWGYTSVPTEGVKWWRNLPTYKEK